MDENGITQQQNFANKMNNRRSLSYENVNEAVFEHFKDGCGEWLKCLPKQIIDSLITLRRDVCARNFTQLQIAANAYFKFLQLNAQQQVCFF